MYIRLSTELYHHRNQLSNAANRLLKFFRVLAPAAQFVDSTESSFSSHHMPSPRSSVRLNPSGTRKAYRLYTLIPPPQLPPQHVCTQPPSNLPTVPCTSHHPPPVRNPQTGVQTGVKSDLCSRRLYHYQVSAEYITKETNREFHRRRCHRSCRFHA